MAEVEYLAVDRASRFITYTLSCDLQVKIHRSTALGHFRGAFARDGDVDVIEFSAEKFDKIMTFLSENDQQVHYANSANTVGVYAIVRLLGDLRRQLRDFRMAVGNPVIGDGPPMLTPRTHRPQAALGGRGLNLNLDAVRQQAARDAAAAAQGEH